MEHAKYLSSEIANLESELKNRMHPLIIAISRVHEQHRDIEQFKTILRLIIEKESPNLCTWMTEMTSSQTQVIVRLLMRTIREEQLIILP